MRIAIIEDEDDLARLYLTALEIAGHAVIRVDQHDLSTIGEVDVVIFDVMMPDVDGEMVADYLAAHHASVRKIAATAMVGVPARVRAIADLVLTKPFSFDDLIEVLEPSCST